MLTAEENKFLTQVGPGTPGGNMLRMYWHPINLSREINDLDDVRMAMGYLTAIRDKETMLDWEFGPVENKKLPAIVLSAALERSGSSP